MEFNAQLSTVAPKNFTETVLEGGAIFQDKTNGIAQAVFLPEESKRSLYKLTINDKHLIFPNSDPSREFVIFRGSQTITFAKKSDLIKLIEVDETTKSVFFIDPRTPVKDIAYLLCSYKPKETSLEEATDKIQLLKSEFPNFKIHIATYNRHGVAAFGYEAGKGYSFYWANPQEEKLKKIDAECCKYRDGGSSTAKSRNNTINFSYFVDKGVPCLNKEPANAIDLETLS